jgi:cytidylate kinase
VSTVTVITGPPGAGKTTVAAALARSRPFAVHLEADTMFHWIVSGYSEPWQPGNGHQNITVTEAIGAAAARYAYRGYDVVVDGIIGPWFLQPFVNALGPQHGDLRYVILRPARDVAMERALGRVGQRALVDPEPVRLMYDAFAILGPFEKHVVDTSSHDAQKTVELLITRLDARDFLLDLPESG